MGVTNLMVYDEDEILIGRRYDKNGKLLGEITNKNTSKLRKINKVKLREENSKKYDEWVKEQVESESSNYWREKDIEEAISDFEDMRDINYSLESDIAREEILKEYLRERGL